MTKEMLLHHQSSLFYLDGNIPTEPAYVKYTSQLIRICRVWRDIAIFTSGHHRPDLPDELKEDSDRPNHVQNFHHRHTKVLPNSKLASHSTSQVALVYLLAL